MLTTNVVLYQYPFYFGSCNEKNYNLRKASAVDSEKLVKKKLCDNAESRQNSSQFIKPLLRNFQVSPWYYFDSQTHDNFNVLVVWWIFSIILGSRFYQNY